MRAYQSDQAAAAEEAPLPSPTLPAIKFTLDGEVFRCRTDLDADAILEWSELGVAASDDTPSNSPEGAAFFSRFLRTMFGTQEYARLRRHFRAHETRPEVMLAIIFGIQQEMAEEMERLTGRPTQAPSPSSPGDGGRAAQRAKVVSLAQGTVTWADPPPPRQRKAPQDRKAKGGGQRTKRASSTAASPSPPSAT